MGSGISRAPTSAVAEADFDPLRRPLAVRRVPTSGGMDCTKGSTVLGLPDELSVDILSRVPAESLRELKLVSRAWRDLIADPFHRKRLPQTLEGFFHGGHGCGDNNYGRFTSLFGSSLPEVDPSFSFLTKLPWIERMALVDSCNGLLLIAYERIPDSFGYIVCNPATKELVFVPSPSGSPPPAHLAKRCVMEGARHAYTFLMFDPASSSHFQLVQLWQGSSMGAVAMEDDVEGMHFYSAETRGWSDRSSEWKRGEEGGEWEQWGEAMIKPTFGRALVNGVLHFLIYLVQKMEALIIAVDGKGKTCQTIRWHEKHEDSNAAFVGQSQGRLHCISVDTQLQHRYPHLYVNKVSVWVLEDYGTQEWILKHSLSCSEVFGVTCSMFDLKVVGMHPDRNVVYFVQHWNKKLVSYDMDSRELHTLCTLGEGFLCITPYVPCFMESVAVANKF